MCAFQKNLSKSILNLFFVLTVSFFSFQTSLHADDLLKRCHSECSRDLGVRLETEFWTAVQNQEVRRFSSKVANIFQGLNIAGIYTRSEQIDDLASATLGSFKINNPVSKRSGDVLVFSYEFVAINSNLTSGPALTTWKKFGNKWKMVSHSYVPFLP